MDDRVPNPYSRHPHQPHPVANHEPTSASSSGSSHTLIPPPSAMLSVAPPSRPLGFPNLSLPPPARSPGSISTYSHSYSNSSTSPSTVAGGLPDHLPPADIGGSGPGLSPTHMSAAGLSAQKRAYRQRRKDPSCDACRERKVKCDATETSSCSECSSRSVRCQFTKETNRRMSSIKQVQDLQSQLSDAKAEIAKLRSMLQDTGAMEVDRKTMELPGLRPQLPEISPAQERRHAPPSVPNFDHVRKNIRVYGRGIFKPPPPYRQLTTPQFNLRSSPALPPKHIVQRLLAQYKDTMHTYTPLLHWTTFENEIDRIYSNGSFDGFPQIWISMFFAILACGTLHTQGNGPEAPKAESKGIQFMETAMQCIGTWGDDMTVDHARTTLLIAIFCTELNLKSAGWIWLGSAVRIAQDLGLHCDSGPWPFVEGEMRRRVWWSIYTWDRAISLEVGRPLLIDDEDCSVGWPCPVDDQYIQEKGIMPPPPGNNTISNGIAAVIPVIRFVSQLKRTLKTRIIADQTLQTYDEYFRAVMMSFPDIFRVDSDGYFDPMWFPLAFTLQRAQYHLYRHNLSTACPHPSRVDALNRMASAARNTVRYISRSVQQPSPSDTRVRGGSVLGHDWHARVSAGAVSFMCSHLWRCTLILCFQRDYHSALSCVRVSAAIGDTRRINIACGRNLAFFLDRLTERIRNGQGSQQHLELDEEMLAYVSADMQGSVEDSWVWSGSETGIKLNASPAFSPVCDSNLRENGEPSDGVFSTSRISTTLTESESREWGGWERVERMIVQLMEEERRPFQQPPPLYHTAPHNASKRIHLAPDAPAPAGPNATSGGVSPGGSSRISIANII